MTDDEGECLGFNEVQVGSGLVIDSVEYKKAIYVRLEDDGLQKVFLKPCIPVSELKKVIKSLNPVDVAGCLTSNRAIVYKMGYRDCKTELKNKLKELGLSKTRKEPEIPDISPFLGYMLKKKEVGK